MGLMQKTILYLKFFVKTFANHPSMKTILGSLRYYPFWLKSMWSGRNSIADKMPWLSFPSIKPIEEIQEPEMVLFEYGPGGSTLLWTSRIKKPASVEHDAEWYHRLKNDFLKQGIGNVGYRLAEAQPDSYFNKKDFEEPNDYISSDEAYAGKNFENYVRQIEEFPDEYFTSIVQKTGL